MLDDKNKDIVPNSDENNENLNENSDFSKELSDLENEIKNAIPDEIKKKEEIQQNTFDELDSLATEVVESGFEWNKHSEKPKDRVWEFFDTGKKEFEKVDTFKEKRVIGKHKKMTNKFADRPETVKEAIQNSSDKILEEIYNWKQEKNPVARSLLKIVNRIMKTEK